MASVPISKAEKSYIQAGFLSSAPLRVDGRAPQDFRPISLETGVSPLANGSARLQIGRNPHDGGGGTEILAASKLEVEDADGGRISCSVSCSPAAYPHLAQNALDDLQQDMTVFLHQTLSHPSLHPPNLGILPGRKSWLLALDVVVLADAGNVYDAIFMAARAALWDTKVPRTRGVEYKAQKNAAASTAGDMDVDADTTSGFDTRRVQSAADFELPDYWDEGEALGGRDRWPVCITLNLVPPVYFLDATAQEEAAVALRLLLLFAFPPSAVPAVQAVRVLGAGELRLEQVRGLIAEGEARARDLFMALDLKLRDEDVRRNQKAREQFSQR